MTLTVHVNGPTWFWHCSDPLEQPKLKLQTRIPLGDQHVRSVSMTKLPFGDEHKPLRISGAVETHNGRRYLHVKALFDQLANPEMIKFQSGINGTFEVETTIDANAGKLRL